MVCSLESQGGGKKGIAEIRDENPIIYLTTVRKQKEISVMSTRGTS
jgi:hypothetical protein